MCWMAHLPLSTRPGFVRTFRSAAWLVSCWNPARGYQLPAPDFRAGHRRTVVTIYGPKPFEDTRAFNNPVAMAEKLFHAVGFRVDIEEVAHPDGRREAD